MTKYASDRIKDLFATGSRDVTPASARHAAYVLYAPVSLDPEVSKHCASVLYGGPQQFDAHLIEGIDSCAALVTRRLA